MTQYLFMCRSLTYAQKTARYLESHGISATAVKAPHGLVGSGCSYGVSVHRKAAEAYEMLRAANMISGKIYRRDEGGAYREVQRP